MPAGGPPSRLTRRPEGWLPGMRIAYVIPAFPPAPSQPFVVNEMIEVQEAGHEVFVVPLYRGATALRHGTFARLRPAGVFSPALVVSAPSRPCRAGTGSPSAAWRAWRKPRASPP